MDFFATSIYQICRSTYYMLTGWQNIWLGAWSIEHGEWRRSGVCIRGKQPRYNTGGGFLGLSGAKYFTLFCSYSKNTNL